MNRWKNIVIFLLIFCSGLAANFLVPGKAAAASAALSLSPSSGTFVVDSTFEVSIYLDTQGQSVNTIELNLKFPPDKLQLVSSSTGKSIIGIWASTPKFNNQTGTINLVGGIPGGVNSNRGLISTFTFRVRAMGSAVVKFDSSQVLLNDGSGTEVMTQNSDSVFDLKLPPPAGPVVVSETHPDQTKWYQSNTASLRWGAEGADGYSYVLNSNPIDVPDDISEGLKYDVVYRNLSEGHHYFHIRGVKDGHWGGTSHYAFNVDTGLPAEFNVEVIPNARTTERRSVIQFATTDALSGMNHYELKIVPLGVSDSAASQSQQEEIFIEAQSPYITNELDLGRYDIIVRAFDNAGNIREETARLEIVDSMVRFVGSEGLVIKNLFVVPWYAVWSLFGLILILLIYTARRLHLWHRWLNHRSQNALLPIHVQQQMEELQKYRSKYGKLSGLILVFAIGFGFMSQALAAEVLTPPLVTTVTQNISDEDIFYIGGRSGAANAEVVIYLQSLESSATMSETVRSDEEGEWFYRHNALLSAGSYLLWTQAKSGGVLSPPSSQITLDVETTALHFGATRISYTTLYLMLMLLFAVLALILVIYIIYKFIQGHKKHARIIKEITEAEASLRRGFAVLNRDIQAELQVIKKAKLSSALSLEEQQKEQQLLKDLAEIEQYLSQEIWDIEEAERTGKI